MKEVMASRSTSVWSHLICVAIDDVRAEERKQRKKKLDDILGVNHSNAMTSACHDNVPPFFSCFNALHLLDLLQAGRTPVTATMGCGMLWSYHSSMHYLDIT